ncbi:MAG TPA: molybdate ABC transporter substrate-binding protein [Thermoanaerobaculia bacterium]|nr:molybdate ABC transporter substrate-binding protein [Thermoanaerobaculia bacterium]
MRRLLAILVAALPLWGAEVRVSAAASLSDALAEIAKGYAPDTIVFNFGASSTLARQIELGAPCDLFLSADEAKMDALAARHLIDTQSRVSVLSNTLVIVTTGEPIPHPRRLAAMKRIALAEPHSVPAGVYAREWLEKLKLWRAIEPNVIPTDNVRAALAAVESGNADAAIVYKTDARIAKRVRVAYEVDRSEGPRISYPFAMMKHAEQPEAARRFLAYLQSRTAKTIFAKHGFIVLQ